MLNSFPVYCPNSSYTQVAALAPFIIDAGGQLDYVVNAARPFCDSGKPFILVETQRRLSEDEKTELILLAKLVGPDDTEALSLDPPPGYH